MCEEKKYKIVEYTSLSGKIKRKKALLDEPVTVKTFADDDAHEMIAASSENRTVTKHIGGRPPDPRDR